MAGIKGMKWGVRKGHAARYSKRRYDVGILSHGKLGTVYPAKTQRGARKLSELIRRTKKVKTVTLLRPIGKTRRFLASKKYLETFK